MDRSDRRASPPVRAGAGRTTNGAAHDPRTDSVLRLQAAAGNQATAGVLGRPSVQREPKAGTTNTGGELRIGGEAIPIQAATWSISQQIAENRTGSSRRTTLHPVATEFGEIVITRDPDGRSGAVSDLLRQSVGADAPAELPDAQLRLDRPSRDGHLPATTLQLRGVTVSSLRLGGGERPTETMVLAVESLSAGGTAGATPKGSPVGSLTVDAAGGDPWLPMPVLDWEEARAGGAAGAVGPGRGAAGDAPSSRIKVRARIVAGTMLGRLTRDMTQAARPTLVFRGPGGREEAFADVLVERIASSGDGPDVIELAFIAEQRRDTPAPRH